MTISLIIIVPDDHDDDHSSDDDHGLIFVSSDSFPRIPWKEKSGRNLETLQVIGTLTREKSLFSLSFNSLPIHFTHISSSFPLSCLLSPSPLSLSDTT